MGTHTRVVETGGCTSIAPDTPDNGGNAFSRTTATFTQPSVSGTVTAYVIGTSWIASGEVVYVTGGGYYTAVPTSPTSITLTNLGYPGNASPTATITGGAAIAPGGLQGATGATGPGGATGPTGPTGPAGANGAGAWNVRSVNATSSAAASDYMLANTTAAGFTITIPAASAGAGQQVGVKKTSADGNTLTVATAGGNIDGAATKTTQTQYVQWTFLSDGSNWFIIA